VVGGLKVRTRKFTRFPWALAKRTFPGNFIIVLVWGATIGIFFISPTDDWVEIITEALLISLIVTAIEVIGAEVYFRWSRDKK
jgi:hypothetical protein